MSKKVMQQALAYIEEVDYGPYDKWPVIIALKQALAEPEQEPVAWRVQRSDGQYELYFLKAAAERAAECYIKRPPVEPLYTAPTPRKPLSEHQRIHLVQSWGFPKYGAGHDDAIGITHSVERAHGIGDSPE